MNYLVTPSQEGPKSCSGGNRMAPHPCFLFFLTHVN